MKSKVLSIECASCRREVVQVDKVEVDEGFNLYLQGHCPHCQKRVGGFLDLLKVFIEPKIKSGNGDVN